MRFGLENADVNESGAGGEHAALPRGTQAVQSRITLPLSPDSIAAKPFS